MKKFLTLMLTAVMAVACCFGLTACGHKHDYVGTVISKGTCTEQGETKFVCAEDGDTYTTKNEALGHSYKNGKCVRCNADAVNPAPIAKENIKIGLICLHGEGSTYDKNFIDAFESACRAKGLTEAQYIMKTDIEENASCKEAAENLVDQGCNIIFADSFGHAPYIKEVAKSNPNVQFYHATGNDAHTSSTPNYHNAFAYIYEGRYLAGVAAGVKLKAMNDAGQITAKNKDENGNIKLGYVGAFTYAEVISGFTSWYLGVKSVMDNVVMDVQFTGSWYNEGFEKNAANTLIEKGCALISQHADSWGAPGACEAAGIPNVSYNGSTASRCPNTFIVSSRINWQPYYEYIIDCAINGKLADTDWSEGLGETLANGSVVLTELGNAAAEGTQAIINEKVEGLKNGTIKVFDCSKFTVKGQHLTSYLADVDNWDDFIPETEVIKTEKGITYFAESEFRSAPYFDIQIDGITYLNVAFG